MTQLFRLLLLAGILLLAPAYGRAQEDDASSQYPHKATTCKPCQALVTRYNNNMDAAREAARRISALQGEIRTLADKPAPKGMSLNDEIRFKANETRKLRRELEQLEREQAARARDSGDFARQIVDCEKRCTAEEEKKKQDIKVGGGEGVNVPMGNRYQPLKTTCKPCEGRVSQYNAYIASLNSLDPDLEKFEELVRQGGPDVEKHRYTLFQLGKQEESLLRAKNKLAEEIEACEFKCKAPKKWPYASSKCKACADTVKAYNAYVDKLFEAEKQGNVGDIRLYKDRLNQGHHALVRCEERCNVVEEGGTHILAPGGGSSSSSGSDIEIELEDARNVDGTNAFDSKEVEHIRVGGERPMPPPPPEKVELPPHIQHPVPPPMDLPKKPTETKVGGGTEVIQPPPPKTPFDPMLATNSGSLRHIMGQSSCPDALGRTSVRTADNRPVNVEITGRNTVIAATVSGSGTSSPGIEIKFTCAVPGTGSYNESVSIKATDPASGESKTLNYSASITVTE